MQFRMNTRIYKCVCVCEGSLHRKHFTRSTYYESTCTNIIRIASIGRDPILAQLYLDVLVYRQIYCMSVRERTNAVSDPSRTKEVLLTFKFDSLKRQLSSSLIKLHHLYYK